MIKFDTKQFKKDMDNIVQYSMGFLEGVEGGKRVFLNNLGKETIEVLKQFVDTNARIDPAALQHVYEWYKSGSPDARLFDIQYTVSGLGLSVMSTFTQSSQVRDGSTTPFYNKARIMENGVPVIIRPKKSPVLVFEDNGETVFTRNPVSVSSPGGEDAQGSFESIVDVFFTQYFKQSFLKMSGLYDYIKRPQVFKTNMATGKRSGKGVGYSTGYKWISNAVIA
ncbi:hypothetical protein UFOVP828_26 [uncultured Caudovirales phage]|uniref:Uncharacterized protein n=1 Tax=uncultured Caudovirales phage TaxID=2100421 RepID=A0A6J5P373_9CAUD|nr:hypothetical protein UFOVP828_26 [uncultured Caudovirales phage]